MGPVGADPLLILLFALFIEGLIGAIPWVSRLITQPMGRLDRLIQLLDDRLNRQGLSGRNRMIRGAIVVLFIIALCWAVGWGITWLSQNYPFGWLIEFCLVVSVIGGRKNYDAVQSVAVALKAEGVVSARRALSPLIARDPAYLDGAGVARAAIEVLAYHMVKSVVGPIFWYVLFGAQGVLIYHAVKMMDKRIGHPSSWHQDFGFVAARVEDILSLIPARLGACLILVAGLCFVKTTPWIGLKTMLGDARWHDSFNRGWPESAMAGCLGLALGGPRYYREGTIETPWMGQGRKDVQVSDIQWALRLYSVACFIQGIVVVGLLVF